ncbi:hypothetical protein H9Y04_44090 [Streptomyces sp. TRM66268-LWL]|uniref:Uncharacterized protein n=1 Tax=Streptomyces polyasparticus TaxID=2767826 RepID=A0ABR7SYR0_9ACTN|nr:hypothetical protein [Streptomyces polyasparticus]MBC9719503.1 hypothetical protein [Streptomyces polyasparticus]
MPSVIFSTPAELRSERQALLGEVGRTYEDLSERAAAYHLTPDEMSVWETIEGIDFLLDEDEDEQP